jgi:hypothetical protein
VLTFFRSDLPVIVLGFCKRLLPLSRIRQQQALEMPLASSLDPKISGPKHNDSDIPEIRVKTAFNK